MRKMTVPLLAGVGVGVSISLVTLVFIPVLFALIVGGAVGLVGGFIVHRALPQDNRLQLDYANDARKRVQEALASVKRIRELAAYVRDPGAKAALLKGCEIVPDLLATTEQKEPGSVASTAARVNVHLRGIETAVQQYLEIQNDPSYFNDAEGRLALGNQGFADFRTFALTSIQQVNENNMIGYKATLDALAPMPELTA